MYDIIYSARKTLALCIKDGRLIVRAPYGTPKLAVENMIDKHSAWIKKHLAQDGIERNINKELTDDQINALKKVAKEIIPEKVKYYSEMMGINYGRITITSAKTRFGSCSAKGDLSFSYRLMMYPEQAVNYVVIHELAHRLCMNHSKKFYAVIESVMPDYKNAVKLLKSL